MPKFCVDIFGYANKLFYHSLLFEEKHTKKALLNPFLEDYVLHKSTVHFYVQSSPTKNIHLN
jgi:hypothetical protein